MIRTLLKLALLIVVALVGYNYFFGSIEEKEQSRAIVDKAKDLGSDAWKLLRSERTKMQEGKYDDALDRLETLYDNLKDEAAKLQDSEAIDRLTQLNERRRELEESLNGDDKLSRQAQRKLDELTADTEVLMHEMEEKGQSGAPY